MQDIDDFFTQISIQVNRAILWDNSVMLVGDFNAELGKVLIPWDVHGISANGKKIQMVFESFKMVAINSLKLCNGVFTRVNNNNPDKKSVLDYMCITKDTTDLCTKYVCGWEETVYRVTPKKVLLFDQA